MIDWTPELEDRIVADVTAGTPINKLAEQDWCPSERAIYYRMGSDEAFSRRMALAREAQQDFEADQCVVMADACKREDVEVVRLRIWARQWRAGKLAAKKYGNKVDLTGTVMVDIGRKLADARRRVTAGAGEPDDGEG